MNRIASLKTMFRSILTSFIFLAVCSQFTLGQESATAKVNRLLQENNYKFVVKKAGVWTVVFNGKDLKSFTVVLASSDDLLVTFVTVAQKKDMELTPNFIQTLLKFNDSLDRVKVGIDSDGDLFVRTDQSIRILDAKEFKDNTEQLAASANEVYAGIKSLLKQ